MINRLLPWLKKPENIFLIVLLSGGLMIGICDGTLEIIVMIYIGAFIFGKVLGFILKLIDKNEE